MAVEWTIAIEGKNDFGYVCRREMRITKSWESLLDGDIGLSMDDGKKVMATLQSAVVAQGAETYLLLRRICPDCHMFRPVKDYTNAGSEPSSAMWRFATKGTLLSSAS